MNAHALYKKYPTTRNLDYSTIEKVRSFLTLKEAVRALNECMDPLREDLFKILQSEVIDLFLTLDQKIEAVKAYRHFHGCSLLEAKMAVDKKAEEREERAV